MSEAAEERARAKVAKQPLEVECGGGELRIVIGIETLAFAIHASPDWPQQFKIVDEEVFAQEVLRALKHEQEDGTTVVHRLLDRAALYALDQGALGVDEVPIVAVDSSTSRK